MLDGILKIHQAEEQSEKIIEEAKQKARNTLNEAGNSALQLKGEVQKEAERMAQEIREQLQAEAEGEALKINEEALLIQNQIMKLIEGNKQRALDFVVNNLSLDNE